MFTREVIIRAVVSIDIPDELTEKAGNMVGPWHISGIKSIDQVAGQVDERDSKGKRTALK
jgi:hypothetical protein